MVTEKGVASRLLQGILAAVLSTVLGAKDPDQVASMAKQAGEVRPPILSPFDSIISIIIGYLTELLKITQLSKHTHDAESS